MKNYLKLYVAILLAVFLLTGCGKESTFPADMVLSLIAAEKLPAGRLYDSEATAYEEHYMPKDFGKSLYAIRGYDELSHVDAYAVYLASGFDAKFESNFTSFAPKAAAKPAAPAAPSFVPEDIDTPVAAAKQPTRSGDMADIDEIFSIFKR